MMKLLWGSLRSWLVVVAIALLLSLNITGCSNFPTVSKQPRGPHDNHHILEFVPRSALLTAMVDITVNPGNAWQRSGMADVVSQTANVLLEPFDINLKDEVRPWLGRELAFAITEKDLDRKNYNGRQVGYLLIADVTDGERLREFLELFWQRQAVAGTLPRLTEVSGVPIIAGTVGDNGQSLAIAVVDGNTLLIANDIRVLYESLRVAQTPTLQALEQLSDSVCCTPGWIKLRIPEIVDWLGLAMPIELQFMSGSQWQQLIATTMFHPDGLLINTQFTTLGNQPVSNALASDTDWQVKNNEPQHYLPKSIAWAAVGHDLQPLWMGLWDELKHYQNLPSFLQRGQQWRTTPLSKLLSSPLTQLLMGDYAVGQLDNGTWLLAVATAQTSAIDQLDSIAERQGLTVSQLTLKGQSVTTWSRLNTQVSQEAGNRKTTVETDLVVLHTKAGSCDVFATSIEGLMAALESPNDTLLSTQRFQKALQVMNSPSQGYVYGTWDKVDRLLVGNRWFSLIKPVLQPWMQSIDVITIANYGQSANQSTGTLSIVLKR